MRSAREPSGLAGQIEEWKAETLAAVVTCRRLISLVGSSGEVGSWEGATKAALEGLEAVPRARRAPRMVLAQLRRPCERTKFVCSRRVAEVVSPLLLVIAGPVPPFVNEVKQSVYPESLRVVATAFSVFYSRFTESVSEPLWTRFPDLSPKEWRAVVAALKATSTRHESRRRVVDDQ